MEARPHQRRNWQARTHADGPHRRYDFIDDAAARRFLGARRPSALEAFNALLPGASAAVPARRPAPPLQKTDRD